MARTPAPLRLRLLVALVGVLACAGVFLVATNLRYRSIVIHHTASTVDDYRSIRSAHRGRGWSDAAYHLILSNGSTEVPPGYLESTWRHRFSLFSVATRSRACNVSGIHLCVVGNFETSEVSVDMRAALAHTVKSLQRRHAISDDRIYLHRDCSNTVCPGKHLTRDRVLAWIASDADRCPAALRAQHAAVLDAAYLSPGHPLTAIALATLSVVGACGFAWLGIGRPSRARKRRSRRRRNKSVRKVRARRGA